MLGRPCDLTLLVCPSSATLCVDGGVGNLVPGRRLCRRTRLLGRLPSLTYSSEVPALRAAILVRGLQVSHPASTVC